MPSSDQIEELVNSCTWQWTQRNGVDGLLLTGPNGNTIFLPAAGYRYDGSLYNAVSNGFYWSRTLLMGDSAGAFGLYFYSGYTSLNFGSRTNGHTVRAVRVP